MIQGACSPKKWWPEYLLVDSVEGAVARWWGSTVYTPPSVFCPFQKCPQWLMLWCFHNRVNVSERGLMLSGHSNVILAVSMQCWLQLCTVTRSSVVMFSGLCCTDTNLTWSFHTGILCGSDAVVILLPWLRWWNYILALNVYTWWAMRCKHYCRR